MSITEFLERWRGGSVTLSRTHRGYRAARVLSGAMAPSGHRRYSATGATPEEAIAALYKMLKDSHRTP